MSTSRVEQMRNDIVSAVQAISTTATPSAYRTNVANVYTVFKDIRNVGSYPSCSVLIWDETATAKNVTRTDWDSDVSVMVLGYVRLTDAEALMHDLKRALSALAISNATSTNRWFFIGANPSLECRRDILFGTDLGWVSVSFKVRVFAQGTDF